MLFISGFASKTFGVLWLFFAVDSCFVLDLNNVRPYVRFSHIFKIPSISNEKPSISIEIPSI